MNDFIAIVWRHKWNFILVFVPIFAITMYLAVELPPIYRSKVTLVVEAPEIPGTEVTSATDGYVEARLASIESRILSSLTLLEIAKKQNIIFAESSDIVVEEAVNDMRDRISREAMIISAPSPRGASTTVSFSLYYEDESPINSKEIANQLGKLYIEENSRIRIGLAEGASNFLKNEADRINDQITKIRGEIATFKKENISTLPENMPANLNHMDQSEVALSGFDRQIQQLELQLIELNRQFRLNKQTGGIALLQQALDDKKAELTQKKLRFHDAHPDIIEINSSIEALEKLLAENAASGDANIHLPKMDFIEKSTDDRLVTTIKSSIKQALSELEYNKNQREIWLEKQEDYQDRLEKSPEVEQQFLRLSAKYDNLKEDLQKIEQKRMTARLSLQLEREKKSERFVVIEPATLPTSPYKPNRPALILLGFVLALGSGVLSIALGERFNTSVNGPEGVMAVLKEPPLAIIPIIDKNCFKT